MNSNRQIQCGHSKATLKCVERNGRLVVEKHEPENFERISRNIEKQQQFVRQPKLCAAEITRMAKTADGVCFEMPFYSGLSGSEIVLNGSIDDLEFLFAVISEEIERSSSQAQRQQIDKSVLRDKIATVLKNTQKLPPIFGPLFGTNIAHAGELVIRKIELLSDYPESRCHGDLTLGNMIFQKSQNRVVLIDFLEVYLNSYLIDIAKIEQDLRYGWSVRHGGRLNKIRNEIIAEKYLPKFKSLVRAEDADLYEVIADLNVMRIAPYCNDKVTANWISNVLRLRGLN